MKWQPISTAPEWKPNVRSKSILCAFEGQFGWVYFVAEPNGEETAQPGFAAPTHWCPIETPNEGSRGKRV